MVFGVRRRSGKRTEGSLRLADAALRVLEIARRERWSLLAIAGRARSADYWFAGNILDIVAVQGRGTDVQQHETLTRERRNGLVLSDDMAGLKNMHDDELRFVDLTLSSRELKRYVKWAQTVQ